MHTLDIPEKVERRRKFSSLGLTREELWNLPILLYLPFNGILNLPASLKPVVSMVTFCFGLMLLLISLRNRFRVRWDLWTCRIAALITVDILLSVAWDVQPLILLIYPCVVAVLIFFYLNYLLDHFSANSLTRMMLWVFGILLALSLIFSIAVPSIGIDNGSFDPNNTGAWQGIFSQKNQLGMATVLAIAMALGIRCKNRIDRFWRALVIVVALVCAAGSRSRESWIAITLQLLTMAFLELLRRFRLRSQVVLLVSGTTLASLLAVFVYTNLDSVLALLGRSRTASGRSYIWEGSLLLIRRRPWLGYGVYGLWRTPIAWDVVVRAGWNVPSSHNNYIEILLYYGIVGLVIYLLLLLSFVLYSFRAFRANRIVEIVPAVYVISGVLMLSLASPITVYFPSAAFLLMLFYISRLEQLERSGFSVPA